MFPEGLREKPDLRAQPPEDLLHTCGGAKKESQLSAATESLGWLSFMTKPAHPDLYKVFELYRWRMRLLGASILTKQESS